MAILRWIETRPWVWSYLAALIVWGVMAVAVHGHGAGGALAVAIAFAAFYTIVGNAQMIVIASGPGNIDLSIPAVMTLSAYVVTGYARGDDLQLILGLLLGVGVGVASAAANLVLIRLLRIPPMIATLGFAFVLQSIATIYSHTSSGAMPPQLLDLLAAPILGLPPMVILVVGMSIAVAFVMERTVFGRSVLAMGQNARAAHLSGVKLSRTIITVYMISGISASIAGILLAIYTGGATQTMASDYLLLSIAAVVLGGTSVAGGQVSVPGVWGASVFLNLIVALLNILQVGAGLRFVMTGSIIILVLATAKRRTDP
jgi:ribose transport system permease protein